MTERISSHFASPVMQESTPRAVTDGTTTDPRGGRNLYAFKVPGNGAKATRAKIAIQRAYKERSREEVKNEWQKTER